MYEVATPRTRDSISTPLPPIAFMSFGYSSFVWLLLPELNDVYGRALLAAAFAVRDGRAPIDVALERALAHRLAAIAAVWLCQRQGYEVGDVEDGVAGAAVHPHLVDEREDPIAAAGGQGADASPWFRAGAVAALRPEGAGRVGGDRRRDVVEEAVEGAAGIAVPVG